MNSILFNSNEDDEHGTFLNSIMNGIKLRMLNNLTIFHEQNFESINESVGSWEEGRRKKEKEEDQ